MPHILAGGKDMPPWIGSDGKAGNLGETHGAPEIHEG